MKRHTGFTLVELIVTLSLVAILATVGVPNFANFIANNRLTAQANELVTSLNLARSEAIKRSSRVSVCRSNNNTSCSGTWNDGWIVFVDANTAGTVDGTDTVLRSATRPGGAATLSATSTSTGTAINFVQFQAIGLTTDATFALTASGCTGQNSRNITVSTSGRIQTQKVNCP